MNTRAPEPVAEADRSLWSLTVGFISLVIGFILSIFISWAVAILIETVGMFFFWPEDGSNHSYQILEQEIKYVQTEGQVGFFDRRFKAIDRADVNYEWASKNLGLRTFFSTLGDYGRAYHNTTLVFFIRISVIESLLILYALFSVWAVVEGLLLRSRRRWTGSVERSFVWRRIKSIYFWAVVLPIPIYLMIPFAIHPMVVAAPFLALYSLALVLMVGYFKTNI